MVSTERPFRGPSLGTEYIRGHLRRMGQENDVSPQRLHELLNLPGYIAYFSLCTEAERYKIQTGRSEPSTEARIQTLREELFEEGWTNRELEAGAEIFTIEFSQEHPNQPSDPNHEGQGSS